MRVEKENDKYILCGVILPVRYITKGQRWSAGMHNVLIEEVKDKWVTYSWIEQGVKKIHEKDSFNFQCRYCLVLGKPEDLNNYCGV